MKCLFIINPSSGTHAFQKSIDKFIGQLILHTNVNTIDTYFTRGKNDGLERAARLTRNEYDFIVAVGGDGVDLFDFGILDPLRVNLRFLLQS